MSEHARVDSFQVHPDDVRHLWEVLLHTRCVGLSPFAGATGDPPPPNATLDDLRALAATPAMSSTVAILANPDLCVDCVIGGGSVAPGRVALYRRRSVDAARVVAVTRSTGGSWLLHRFDDAGSAAAWLSQVLGRVPDFVAWDADTLAEVAATVVVPSQVPDDMPLETLIYLFHTIDMFRRVTYEHLLAHTPVDGPIHVSAADFRVQLGQSLRSGDLRWLLPAFHQLMPDLARFTVDPRPEHLAMPDRVGILSGGRRAGEEVFTFGEVGTRLGIEFFRTWHCAAAIAHRRRGEHEDQGQRWFLTPTAFTNHVFVLEPRPGGHCSAHHEALSPIELGVALQALVDAAVEAELPGASVV